MFANFCPYAVVYVSIFVPFLKIFLSTVKRSVEITFLKGVFVYLFYYGDATRNTLICFFPVK